MSTRRTYSSYVRLFGRPRTKYRPFALRSVHKEGLMCTLAHGLPSRPLGAHLAVADVLSGGCCWSSSTRPIVEVVEVYRSVSAGRTVPGERRVRICVLFNIITVRYTRGTSPHTPTGWAVAVWWRWAASGPPGRKSGKWGLGPDCGHVTADAHY